MVVSVAAGEDWVMGAMNYLVVSSDAYNEAFGDRRVIAVEVDSRAGPILMPGVVPRLSETPGSVRWSGPAVGEHTSEVMEQLDLGLHHDART